jgi:tetratricopeptide (TPR) repeat protein
MHNWSQYRCCQTFTVLAALGMLPLNTFAQVSTEPSGQPPATLAQSQTPNLNPAVQPTAKELGDALMVHQRYQAAIESYRKVPRPSADALNQMGIAYQMMFNLHEAVKCYEASLRLEPQNANVLNNLGTVYDSLKIYGAAERMYRKALRLDPESAMIEKNLGTNLLAQHHYKKGWQAYQAALAIDPQVFKDTASLRVENPASTQDRGAMNYYMARGCVRAGQNDCAIDYLRMALNEGYTNPKKIEADIEFASLRGIPAFEQLLAAQHSR